MSAGKANLAITPDGTYHQLTTTTPATGKYWTINVMAVNNGTINCSLDVAISTATAAGSVVLADQIHAGKQLASGDTFEHAGLLVMAGEYVWVRLQAGSGVAAAARAHWVEGTA
jgi:hypothetical protein